MRPFRVRAAAAGVLRSATLLLLTAVLATTHALSTTTPSSTTTTSCEPAACGQLRIAYPFWLTGTHPPECGYHAFQVTCDGAGRAVLQNSFWKYHILDISYQDSSFRVTNVELSGGTCDVELRVNASSDLGLAPFAISAANQELFLLYNCTDLQARPPPPTWAPVNCTNGSSNVSTTFNSFAWLAGGYQPDDRWGPVPGGCKVSMMPVMGYPGAAGADYRRLMKGGFLLDYTAGDCAACVDSGGLCRINTTYDVFECHCSHGVSDLIICDCQGPSRSTTYVPPFLSKPPIGVQLCFRFYPHGLHSPN